MSPKADAMTIDDARYWIGDSCGILRSNGSVMHAEKLEQALAALTARAEAREAIYHEALNAASRELVRHMVIMEAPLWQQDIEWVIGELRHGRSVPEAPSS